MVSMVLFCFCFVLPVFLKGSAKTKHEQSTNLEKELDKYSKQKNELNPDFVQLQIEIKEKEQ